MKRWKYTKEHIVRILLDGRDWPDVEGRDLPHARA